MIAMGITTRSKMTFIDWLEQELKKRRWRQTDLAQEMGMSDSTLSHLFAGNRNPGPDLCNGIARAFGVAPEEVFRMAGLLPPLPEQDDELARRLVESFKRLPIEKRQEVLSFVEWKVREVMSGDIPEFDGSGKDQGS